MFVDCQYIHKIPLYYCIATSAFARGTGRDRVQNDPTSWLSQIWNYKISKFAQQRSGVVSSLVNEMEWYDETGFYRFLDSAIHGLRA